MGGAALKSQEMKQNMGTEEFMQHVRNEANKKLERGVPLKDRLDDVDHAVKTTRALMSANKEIWERCSSGESSPENEKLIFKRVGFTKVQVKTISQQYSQTNTLSFEAIPELTMKDFGKPPAVPEQLTAIINPTLDNNGIFTDYEKYLETALLLNEDTLLPFLSGLKKHLEDVQIFLGDVDGWLMSSSFCSDFIMETFEQVSRASLVPASVTGCNPLSCGQNHSGLSCLICKQKYRGTGYGSPPTRCPDARFGHSTYHSYYHSNPVFLLSLVTDGKHEHTFDITEEAQQAKLKRFLHFVRP